MKFKVPDMSCGHCKAAIDSAVKTLDGTARLEFDMENRTVGVTSDRSAGEISGALKEAGYESQMV